MNDQERAAFDVALSLAGFHEATWVGDKGDLLVLCEKVWEQARAALAAAPVQAVPGWALVPLHATPEMVSAAEGVEDLYKRGTPQTWAAVFRAMLAAAPAAPQVPEAAPHWLEDEMLVPLIYSAIVSAGRPKTIGDFEAAAERVADMLRRKAAPGAPQPAEPAPLTDAQIEAGRRETFSTENPFCPCDSKTMRKAVRWAEHVHGIRAAGVKEPPNAQAQPGEASAAAQGCAGPAGKEN